MKTLKEIAVFFGTFMLLFVTLSIFISLLTWEEIYNTIHSPWSFLTFIISLMCAILVTVDYSEQREA
jgi:hypothetical protein